MALIPCEGANATKKVFAATARRRRSDENTHPETLTGGEKNT